ncbi:MAG TPA: hypothetical protein VHY20_13970 [Pirellulales bacterium]|nr:hypothetical protein [Pirellulales bacterium]
MLRGAEIVSQLAEIGGNVRLCIGIRSVPAAQPIGAALQSRFEIGLIEIAERIAKFGGGGMLIGSHLARRATHLLLELAHAVG